MAVATPIKMRARDRTVAALLLLLLGIGCLALWTAVPAAVLWTTSQMTESASSHLVLGIIGVPLAMVLFAQVLLWINRLYLRVTLPYAVHDSDQPPRIRGPLEPMVLISMPVALIGLIIFVLVFLDTPQLQAV